LDSHELILALIYSSNLNSSTTYKVMQQQDNEQLGDFLREMFNDYEAEPLDSSWGKIRRGIVPPPSQKPRLGWKPWLAGIIVLIGLIGTFTATQSRSNVSENQSVRKKTQAKDIVQPQNLLAQEIAGNSTTLTNGKTLFVNAKSEKLANPLVHSTSVIISEKEIVKTVSLKKETTTNQQEPRETSSSLTSVLVKNVSENRSESNETPSILTASINENTMLSGENTVPVLITIENRKIEAVNSLSSKPSSKLLVSLNPILPQFKQSPIEFKKKSYPLEFTISATPFFTYQRQQAILQASGKEIQNIQTYESFTRNRAGMNLNIGLSRQLSDRSNIRIGLSYTYMSQWADYEIAQDAFTLRRSSARSQDNIVRDGIAVKELERIKLLGLSVNKQYFLNPVGKVRYFASVGAEGMLNTVNGNQHIFATTSIGISYHLSNSQSLTIEPTASYDLVGGKDSNSLLKVNPYNLGIKLGLGFGKR
jgi:hypothetical protein